MKSSWKSNIFPDVISELQTFPYVISEKPFIISIVRIWNSYIKPQQEDKEDLQWVKISIDCANVSHIAPENTANVLMASLSLNTNQAQCAINNQRHWKCEAKYQRFEIGLFAC